MQDTHFIDLFCLFSVDVVPAVIVAPNGMLGRLTGCCPSELVKQVYVR